MNLPFNYDRIAENHDIIGRRAEAELFFKSIYDRKRSVAIYGAPKSGKESFIRYSLDTLESRGLSFILCEINLFNIRTMEDFISLFKEKMLECYNEIHYNSILPFEIHVDSLDERKILNLPEIIATDAGKLIIIYFKEFQNLLQCSNDQIDLEDLDKIWSKQTNVRYIFSGSFVNQMKYIFEEKKYFYFMCDVISLEKLKKKECVDYIVRSFQTLGRVIQDEQAGTIYHLADGNIWYIKHLCSICMSMPIGYVNNNIIKKATDSLISLHTPRFMQIMMDLTPNQINFLKAVVDGVQRFSSQEILEGYHLNSSANVFRLKDALKKKEVLTFDKEDNAIILDTLFAYWLKNTYFQ
ncbi:MAG TPA: hypothetical protein PK979_02520 [Bacteroidales bacterium]|nr:hypothetical protein [Bacteroidales bacterium]